MSVIINLETGDPMVTTAASGGLILGTTTGTAADGGVVASLGAEVTALAGGAAFGDGLAAPKIPANASTTSDVSLSANGATVILAVPIPTLLASSSYMCTIGATVKLWSTTAVRGCLQITAEIGVVTDSGGVKTCSIIGTPTVTTIGADSALSTATINVAASGDVHGVNITATRVAGLAMTARVREYTDKWELLGAAVPPAPTYSIGGFVPNPPVRGAACSFTWYASGGAASGDWCGIFAPGVTPGSGGTGYAGWVYVGGVGQTSGTVAFTFPSGAAGAGWSIYYFNAASAIMGSTTFSVN